MNKTKFKDFSIFIILLLCILFLALKPAETSAAVTEGLSLCMNTIVPSLFPFFVITSLFIKTGSTLFISRLLSPIMTPLFRVSSVGAVPFTLGLIGGYPLGAKTIAELYMDGKCSKKEAEKLLGFCCNCGPAFIIGVIGAKILNNLSAGFMIYLIHILSAVITGFVLRGRKNENGTKNESSLPKNITISKAITVSVKDSVKTIFDVCGFIVFFLIVMTMLENIGVFKLIGNLFKQLNIDSNAGIALFKGIIELSNGINGLTYIKAPDSFILSTIIVSWGGLSVHFQTAAVLDKARLKMSKYYLGKTIQAIISGILSYITLTIWSEKVFVFRSFQYESNSTTDSPILIICILILFLLAELITSIKHRNKCGKCRRKMIE